MPSFLPRGKNSLFDFNHRLLFNPWSVASLTSTMSSLPTSIDIVTKQLYGNPDVNFDP